MKINGHSPAMARVAATNPAARNDRPDEHAKAELVRARRMRARASNLLATTAKPAIRPAEPPTATTNATAPTSTSEPLTVDGLLKNWGKTDGSPYDLNADGVAGPADLAALLAQLGEQPDEGQEPQAPADPRSKLDALLAAWGTDNPEFDFDGDGTVGPADLAELLSQLASPPSDTPTAKIANPSTSATEPPDVPVRVRPAQVETQSPVDQLLAAWGTDNKKFDLNNDGTVGPADLAQLLAQLGENQPSDPAAPVAPSIVGRPEAVAPSTLTNAGARVPAEHDLAAGRPMERPESTDRPDHARLTRLASQLASQLREAGFKDQPPSNVRDVVNGLDLGRVEREFLMARLARLYPRGLGVNAVG